MAGGTMAPGEEPKQTDGAHAEKFRCHSCQKSFKTHFSLNMHLKKRCGQTADIEGESFTCTICQRVFTSPSALIQHVNTHVAKDVLEDATPDAAPDAAPDDVFECTICGKRYDSPDALYQHVWTHVVNVKEESGREEPENGADSANGDHDDDSANEDHDEDSANGDHDEESANGDRDEDSANGDHDEDSGVDETEPHSEDPDDRHNEATGHPKGKDRPPPRLKKTVDGRNGDGQADGTASGKVGADSEPQYSCRYCGKTYQNTTHCKAHEKAHELHPCNLCNKILHGVQGLKLHQTRVHGRVPDYQTKSKSDSKNESKNESKTKVKTLSKTPVRSQPSPNPMNSEGGLYQCSVCSKRFKNQAWLTRHSHQPQCNGASAKREKPAKTSTAEKRSQLAETPAASRYTKKWSECSRCVKEKAKLKLTSNMTDNRKSHHCPHKLGGERPFHCTFCPWRFKSLHHLKEHLMSHVGVRPFECAACKKRFVTKRNLRSHSLVCKLVAA